MKNEAENAHQEPAKGDTAALAMQAECTLARFGGGKMSVVHEAFSARLVERGTKEEIGSIGVTLGGHFLQIFDHRDNSTWQIPIAAVWSAYDAGRLELDLKRMAQAA